MTIKQRKPLKGYLHKLICKLIKKQIYVTSLSIIAQNWKKKENCKIHIAGEDRYSGKQQKLEQVNVKLERRQSIHAMKRAHNTDL